ncbi:Putative adhesin [Clostridium cavendishii DSM 21758]|uniref:Putative adhesin n=1 Tax=Clostridium cavendishii DSM 21758 TaxID=1121302 RepID=A0A1M6I4C2_9CLOT|nr:DUF4097 family beta strand repeat-containing protein [Clostridium cavendishii]SHJ29272.1 Putative adhesin [Clostridium cavendishii DSM 21758]
MRIKKVLSVLLVLSAVTLTGCDVHFDIGQNSKISKISSKDIKEIDKSFKLNNVNDLRIAIGRSDVNIVLTDGDEIRVKGKIYDGNDNVISKQSGSTMTIEEKDLDYGSWDSEWNFSDKDFSFFRDNNSEIDIEIPKAYKENIGFKFGAGDVKINDLEVKKIDFKADAGNVNIDNIIFNDLDIKCGAGNLDINLKKKNGNIDIKGGVGNTKITLKEVGGNLKIAGGVGNSTIDIPDNSPVDIKAAGGLGNTNISAKTSGENKYTFDIKAGVGNISVK